MQSMTNITINLPPITKKNHQQIVRAGDRVIVVPSKQYKRYEKDAAWMLPQLGIDHPVNVQCLFYMPTHRKCDLTNLLEAVDDVMVKAGTIADDNFHIVAGHDGSRVLYDKDNPRTEITITDI